MIKKFCWIYRVGWNDIDKSNKKPQNKMYEHYPGLGEDHDYSSQINRINKMCMLPNPN